VNRERVKSLLKLYGCVFAGFLLTGVALSFVCAAAQKSWGGGLARQAANLFGDEFAVGERVAFSSAFGTTGAAFSLKTPQGDAVAGRYAVIMRVATLYGPAVCVFLCGTDGYVEFKGTAGIQESLAPQFNSPVVRSQIAYWERRMPGIVKTVRAAR
jgi:hypothetical protein